MVKNLSRKPLTKSPGYNFQKKCHPRMGIFQLPPSKCPCKDFSISLFLHPNNLCWRMRENFFFNLRFRVYNSVSFLAHSVSMIMSCHFYRVIFSPLIPCQCDDTEFLFDCQIPGLLYHVNFILLKFKLGIYKIKEHRRKIHHPKVKCPFCEKEFAQKQNVNKHVAVAHQ